ncbi:hypothetical protein ACWGJX_43000 [Streptomyces sp. NPDC054775]
MLADVAAGGRPVLIMLSVRRLFCDSPGCGPRTFAEQVEGCLPGACGAAELSRPGSLSIQGLPCGSKKLPR